MRLLVDQDVYAATVRFLRGLGHDLATAAEKGMSRSDDADLLRAAEAEGRVFVTRDRDYGGLVFSQGLGTGVLYLRMLPSTLVAVHAELGRVLSLYSEADLLGLIRGRRAEPSSSAKVSLGQGRRGITRASADPGRRGWFMVTTRSHSAAGAAELDRWAETPAPYVSLTHRLRSPTEAAGVTGDDRRIAVRSVEVRAIHLTIGKAGRRVRAGQALDQVRDVSIAYRGATRRRRSLARASSSKALNLASRRLGARFASPVAAADPARRARFSVTLRSHSADPAR